MSVYILLLVFLTSLALCTLDFCKESNYTKYIFNFFILILFIVSSTKDYNTSFDTSNYVLNFNKNGGLTYYNPLVVSWYEPGYVFIETIVKSFTNNVSVLFGVISLISLSILRHVIIKFSKYKFISLFLYVSLFYFKRDIITIRYGLSCLLCIWGLLELISNNKKKAHILFFISILFHYSAIAILGFLPFYSYFKKKSAISCELLNIVSLSLAIVGINILSIIVILVNYLPNFLSYGIAKGLMHLDDEESGGFKQIVPYIPLLLFYHKTKFKPPTIKSLYLILLFSIFCMIELNQAASFARVNQIFLTIIIILIPKLLYLNKNKILFKYILLYTLFLGIYMYFRICFFNTGGFINIIY